MTKHIFVTGGVVSSLGKGLTSASIGMLLEQRGLSVRMQKLDPYINVDPGTMSPYQHGEVYVLDDGSETDLDLGHYERFTNSPLTRDANYTTGQIYLSVIEKERRGEFLGKTVQVIPHVTNEIKECIHKLASEEVDVVITEIGGTVGDIESQPFLEAIRQFSLDAGKENCLYVHLTLVPYLKAAGELKTKPTQHSVGQLREIGIQPDVLICRTEKSISREDKEKMIRWGHVFFSLKGLFLLLASALLVKLIFEHQFQYYYVFNYTSLDLAPKYLWSAFYGGQEGSFMLWILFSCISGFMLIKWTREPYRAPVMFFLTLTQVFLLSMIVGWHADFLSLGASPFRTIAEEMPNAPFIQANPDFVPADGSGLNDLLKSPWMMIHPPVLFIGFAMMTIPYCFAMAALWKRKYNDWVGPALPWTLGANLALLTAIFLGGYWAYITLSFGGYWAWDPVENASLVPWLFGTAGIHTMIIQRKSSIAQKSSLLFAILAYIAIVYETFLTRSGILADSSVHSFVDLGLYNQLLVFMLMVTKTLYALVNNSNVRCCQKLVRL